MVGVLWHRGQHVYSLARLNGEKHSHSGILAHLSRCARYVLCMCLSKLFFATFVWLPPLGLSTSIKDARVYSRSLAKLRSCFNVSLIELFIGQSGYCMRHCPDDSYRHSCRMECTGARAINQTWTLEMATFLERFFPIKPKWGCFATMLQCLNCLCTRTSIVSLDQYVLCQSVHHCDRSSRFTFNYRLIFLG